MKSWKEIQQNVNIELLLGGWITGNSFLLFYFIILVFLCVFLFLIEIIVDIKYYVSGEQFFFLLSGFLVF